MTTLNYTDATDTRNASSVLQGRVRLREMRVGGQPGQRGPHPSNNLRQIAQHHISLHLHPLLRDGGDARTHTAGPPRRQLLGDAGSARPGLLHRAHRRRPLHPRLLHRLAPLRLLRLPLLIPLPQASRIPSGRRQALSHSRRCRRPAPQSINPNRDIHGAETLDSRGPLYSAGSWLQDGARSSTRIPRWEGGGGVAMGARVRVRTCVRACVCSRAKT
jgi:hypothetical protein